MNKKGMTLVEVMITAGIIGASAAAMMGIAEYVNKQRWKLNANRDKDRIVHGLVEHVRNNFKEFQKSYVRKLPSEAMSDFDTTSKSLDVVLPIAWTRDCIGTPAECPLAQGRMGFTIHPYPANGYMSGMYVVTLGVKNKELFQSDEIKYFQFMVSD